MKYILSFIMLSLSINSYSGEWVVLSSENYGGVEIFPDNFGNGISEGIYFLHKTNFPSAEDCSSKKFVVITDTKLADRALSLGLFANSTGKTIKLWVDGCSNNYLHGKAIKIEP